MLCGSNQSYLKTSPHLPPLHNLNFKKSLFPACSGPTAWLFLPGNDWPHEYHMPLVTCSPFPLLLIKFKSKLSKHTMRRYMVAVLQGRDVGTAWLQVFEGLSWGYHQGDQGLTFHLKCPQVSKRSAFDFTHMDVGRSCMSTSKLTFTSSQLKRRV